MAANSSEAISRILIVDDDRAVAQILAKILRRQGYDVETAESAQDAMEKISRNGFRAALIDVHLQDMNGLDLLSMLQKTAPRMSKIILTGYPSDSDKVTARQRGADDYLAKPIRSEKLLEAIETRIKRKDSVK